MRSLRHLTRRYIWDRSILAVHERRHPEYPWLTNVMTNILDTWLQPDDVGLEYGSGRSTRWFADRVGHLTSVESDADWFAWVKSQLSGIKSVDYYLCEHAPFKPDESEYVGIAKNMPSESIDFCLVDGVARDHCASAAIDKLKRGGILILDNVNWYILSEGKSVAPNTRSLQHGYASPLWQEVGEMLAHWRYIWTSNGVTDTAL